MAVNFCKPRRPCRDGEAPAEPWKEIAEERLGRSLALPFGFVPHLRRLGQRPFLASWRLGGSHTSLPKYSRCCAICEVMRNGEFVTEAIAKR